MVDTEERLFAVTSPGLAPAVLLEARALGWTAEAGAGGVALIGPSGLHRRANLELRCATRVLLRVAEVPADDERVLARALDRISLRGQLEPRVPAALQVATHRSRLRPPKVEALARKVWGIPPPKPSSEQEGGIWLRVDGNRCTVSVDTSGQPLHRRGYREELSRAPLRETLAAGLLVLAGYDGSGPLWDPMCGSGTIPIEAAWIARGRPPGLGRHFAFEAFPAFDEGAFRREVEQAKGRMRPKPPEAIRASDLNAGALGVARRNARRAGVAEWLEFERRDFTQAPRAQLGPAGWIVANLPYGKRVGERRALVELYRRVGEVLREDFTAWRTALLTLDSPELNAALGLAPHAIHRLVNGGLHCRLAISGPGST